MAAGKMSLPSPRAFFAFQIFLHIFTERLFTTILKPGTGKREERGRKNPPLSTLYNLGVDQVLIWGQRVFKNPYSFIFFAPFYSSRDDNDRIERTY